MFDTEPLLLREQFGTAEQQRETSTIGMWIFLVTEVMMFGGLFTAFTVYRMYYPQAFIEGSAGMKIILGSVNTAILLTSSFMMTLAVRGAEVGKQRQLFFLLVLTMLLGALFLGIKFTEYYQHYQEHKVPGVWFESNSPLANKEQMFYVFYFIMTGLHAVHMMIGLGIVGAMAWRTTLGSFTAEYHTPVQITGLYWHFVDIVWTFLYVLLYLPGLHT